MERAGITRPRYEGVLCESAVHAPPIMMIAAHLTRLKMEIEKSTAPLILWGSGTLPSQYFLPF